MQTQTQTALEPRARTPLAADRRGATTGRTLTPRLDVVEGDEAFQAIFEMPGVPETGVHLTVERGVLRVEATPEQPALDGYELTYSELRAGRYERSLRLGDAIDPDRISAHMKAGMLYVTLPKRSDSLPRRIEVAAA